MQRPTGLEILRSLFGRRKNRTAKHLGRRPPHARRVGFESLETREMLAASATSLLRAATTSASTATRAAAVSAVPVDNYGATFATATSLTLAADGSYSLSGYIPYAGRVDVFKFVAPLTGKVTIRQNLTTGSPLDPILYVYDNQYRTLAQNDDSNSSLNATVTVSVAQGSLYYVKAAGVRTTTGGYTLQFSTTASPGNPYPTTLPQAYPVALTALAPTILSGTIVSTTDCAYFSVVAPATGILEVLVTPPASTVSLPRPLDPFLYAYNSLGQSLAQNNKGQGTSAVLKLNVTSGLTYYFKVAGNTGTTGSYSAEFTMADNYGSTLATATAISVVCGTPTTISGQVEEVGGVNMFRFVAPASGITTFQAISPTGSTLDPILYLINGTNGRELTHNDDYPEPGSGSKTPANRNSYFQYGLINGQTYYVKVGAFSTTLGAFTMIITAPSGDDVGNTFASGTALTLGPDGSIIVPDGSGSLAATIDYVGDADVFSFVPATTCVFTVRQQAATGSTVDPCLYVYDSSGNLLAQNDDNDGNLNSRIDFNVTGGQTYYVKATGFGNTTGAYYLKTAAPMNYFLLPNTFAPGIAITGQVSTFAMGQVLIVRGTDAADTITLSQSNSLVTLTTASSTQTFTGPFAGVAVYGFGGADRIQFAYTMPATEATLVYGGLGDDKIFDAAMGKGYDFGEGGNDLVVAIGGGGKMVYGGAGTDSYWVDANSAVNDVDAAETNVKALHVVRAFQQLGSTPALAVPMLIAGQSIADPVADVGPAAPYTWVHFSNPLFNGTPQFNDIMQSDYLGDCYFISGLSALAERNLGLLLQSITELGDGTFAVRFFTSRGAEKYYRLDADLPMNGSKPLYAQLTRNGSALWVAMLEKAFTEFRWTYWGGTPNTYSSIDGGYADEALQAVTGQPAVWYMTWNNSANSMAQYMAAQLAANHAVTAGTPGTSMIPIIPGHAYNVHSVSQDTNGVWWITVYNPWGIDGDQLWYGTSGNWDSNPNDGLLTINAATFMQAFQVVCVGNAVGP